MTTPKWVIEKIQEAKQWKLHLLNLNPKSHYDPLTEIPDEIGELGELRILFLSGNRFNTLPNSIAQLKKLESLDISYGHLSSLPESIAQLKELRSLNISSNHLSSLPESITQLKELESLNISGNHLSSLPESITQLENLASLALRSNQLSNLPDTMVRMKKLKSLFLERNNLQTLPEIISEIKSLRFLYLGDNKLAELPKAISYLQNLVDLDLDNNRFTELPDSIVELKNLKLLNLRNNNLTTLPASISQLSNLTTLNLSFNLIAELPYSIKYLKALEHLDLSNNKLTRLPDVIDQLINLALLKLDNNPLIAPPPEVVGKGIVAIQKYFRQLREQGEDQLYEAKLLILGEGGAGKTTLAKKIEDSNYELRQEEKSTEGVDVTTWMFPLEGERFFRVNIWDFGGQEIYHATHQFFLTKRSLYALVADTRKEDTDFYYWLNVVELLSDNSPLLIVKNEKQDRHREINERQLRGQFENLKEVLATNLGTNRGLDKVKAEIEHYVKNLPHIGSPLPKTWVRVRERLENDQNNYISLDEYFVICKENGFTRVKDGLQLSAYLNDIGVFLHFQDDPLLRKTVILKPKWGTDAVYKVLDNKVVIKNLGRFTRADLNTIWDMPEYENMRDELLQLMMKFKLCYEIPSQIGVYIAPQLLTENQPDYRWDNTDNLLLRYTYEFMPKGILQQFIVVINRFIVTVDAHSLVWRSGVVVAKDKTAAEIIEHYGRRQIHIRIAGAHKKELMTIVVHELDQIHDTYKRLKYDKLIPCNCKKCKANTEPHFYKYEQLQNFIEKRIFEIQCGATGNMVNVRGLIDDVVGWKSEKEVEEIMAKQKFQQMQQPSINVGSVNIGGNAKVDGFNLGGIIQDSFNKAESADISGELKETLKQLAFAVDAMNKELPLEKSKKVEKYYNELVDQTIEEKPDPEWYNVSINGLIKAADNIGEVGDRVINLSKKVLSILTGGIIK